MVAIVLVGVLTVALAGRLERQNGYVSSPNGELSFRYPKSWADVSLTPLSTEWVTGVDASDSPSSDHLATFVLDRPFVVAQVIDLAAADHDRMSVSSLRSMALNDRRDPTAGDDPTIRLIFHDPFLDDRGFEGQILRFEVDMPEGTAVEQQFAAFDPGRQRIHRVRVACSASCFEAYDKDIESLFDSVQLGS
ncbi:MAG: hypothetical protein R2761_00355 [Acidimicrobiales bacterium]